KKEKPNPKRPTKLTKTSSKTKTLTVTKDRKSDQSQTVTVIKDSKSNKSQSTDKSKTLPNTGLDSSQTTIWASLIA
ncbi:hypothetical protein LB336_16325, partial [Staphylococcus aureus]